jgi:hypothetical protein
LGLHRRANKATRKAYVYTSIPDLDCQLTPLLGIATKCVCKIAAMMRAGNIEAQKDPGISKASQFRRSMKTEIVDPT